MLRGAGSSSSITQYHLIGPKLILQNNEEQGVLQQMVWSPRGSQLNSMESIWDYMKRQKQLRQSKSTEPWQVPQDALNNLPAKFLHKEDVGQSGSFKRIFTF